jgi:hypothetical protein
MTGQQHRGRKTSTQPTRVRDENHFVLDAIWANAEMGLKASNVGQRLRVSPKDLAARASTSPSDYHQHRYARKQTAIARHEVIQDLESGLYGYFGAGNGGATPPPNEVSLLFVRLASRKKESHHASVDQTY